MINKILVTGATGFIGSCLAKTLLSRGAKVRITGQFRSEGLEALGAEWFPLPDLSGPVDWGGALEGVTKVVHLAGMAHRVSVDQHLEAQEYDHINHLATRSIASSIRKQKGIEKFIFLSSVAVHGDHPTFPLRADHPLNPNNPYGKSKLAAELAIRELLADAPLKWVIYRPVLVYGAGNPGNMARLDGLVRRNLPVPVSRTANRRSFLFLGNLVDAICHYLDASAPPSGKAYIVADRETLSTADLVMALAAARGVQAKIWHLPKSILDGTAKVGDVLRRLRLPSPWNTEVRNKLLGDYYVDSAPIRDELRWDPPFSAQEGIRALSVD